MKSKIHQIELAPGLTILVDQDTYDTWLLVSQARVELEVS